MKRGYIALLLSIGFILILIGWYLQLNGIRMETCKSYATIYKEFEGFVNSSKIFTVYQREVPLNISGLKLTANSVKGIDFYVNKTIGFVTIRIVGRPSDRNYGGIVRVLDKNSNEVLSSSLFPFKSAERDKMDISLMFMKNLEPGLYHLELSLNTSAYIDSLQLYGATSRDQPATGIAITLKPSAFDTLEIEYLCKINFTNMVISTATMVSGLIVILISVIIMFKTVPKVSIKSVKVGKKGR